jgi:tRNA-specific 2-thiouridylase
MKTKVLVAMSGGVDSSVAALLMRQKGYEVIGAFMKNYSDSKNKLGECNWKEEREYAKKIAAILGIPLITLDYEKEYKKQVIGKMFSDYKKGITPNPDIDCNQKIKFPYLIKAAKRFNCDFVVTGHYSKIKKTKKGFKLLRGLDESKDQSYFLYRLKQDELKKLLFPIGDYTKKEIREIAQKNKFPNFDKKGTVGICFVGKVNLKNFLSKKIKPKKGKILDPDGNQIGEHDGVYYYTIGQRLGPRYGFEVNKKSDDKKLLKKWYVAFKDVKKNIIIAAPENHPLNYRKEIVVKNLHLINPKGKIPNKVLARIRQVGELLPAEISKEKDKLKVTLKKAITGISEGQAIVLYRGFQVLGGGEIEFG